MARLRQRDLFNYCISSSLIHPSSTPHLPLLPPTSFLTGRVEHHIFYLVHRLNGESELPTHYEEPRLDVRFPALTTETTCSPLLARLGTPSSPSALHSAVTGTSPIAKALTELLSVCPVWVRLTTRCEACVHSTLRFATPVREPPHPVSRDAGVHKSLRISSASSSLILGRSQCARAASTACAALLT
jgi:hypothetical protein